jgi:hypothetical protein
MITNTYHYISYTLVTSGHYSRMLSSSLNNNIDRVDEHEYDYDYEYEYEYDYEYTYTYTYAYTYVYTYDYSNK